MSKSIVIGGFDPSMRNMGMIKGVLDLSSGILSSIELQLIETKKDNAQKDVRQNSKDLARAKDIYDNVHNFFSNVEVLCVEMPVGSQTASAMKSYGMCVMLCSSFQMPLIEVTPYEVKKAATGNKNATKSDMVEWATSQYPDVPWLSHNGKITGKNEHIADALAAIYAGVNTRQFQLLTLL